MGIKIFTDSTSYIDKSLQEELNINILPLSIHFPDESYPENEVDYDYFYNKIESTGIIPTSSLPAPGTIFDAFEKTLANGDDILGIFISSAMSGTYDTALSTKEQLLQKYPAAKIEIFDSCTNCMALGIQVLEAARAVKSGLNMQEALQIARNTRNRVHFYFVPETLKYLKKGGRIGTASALLGSILNIHPILTVDMEKGMTHLLEKCRGSSNAIKRIINLMEEDSKKFGLKEIIVHHINAPAKAQQLKEILMERYALPVSICTIGPVIGLHTGLGTVGVVYSTVS
ncbi:MAG: DegV family protein [Syntrophomonadaceae bacterium]|nr:DegV family protein [Syntrophomonadaceae bacterium]MDD3024174.1 DegV family protein [Syntrophomonadaceae bacterium]